MFRNRTIDDFKRSYAERVEIVGGAMRARMTPLEFTPSTAGVACFACVTVVLYFAQQFGTMWFGLRDASMAYRLGIAGLVGAICGVFDYFYTRNGNERGRWDLILNKRAGTLQLPATTAYRQPETVALTKLQRLQLKTIVDPNPDEDVRGIYLLSVVCRHVYGAGTEIAQESFTSHAVAQSFNHVQLMGMAEWLQEFLELTSEIESASCDSSLVSEPLSIPLD